MEFKTLTWNDCTVEQWQEVLEIIATKGILPTDFVLEIGDVFFDIPDDLGERDLRKLKTAISFIKSPVSEKYKQEVNGNQIKKLSRLSLANYIDLDVLLVNNSLTDALPNAVKILYDLNDAVYDVKITDVYGAVMEFRTYRKQVGEKYPTVFDSDEDGEFPEGYEPEPEELEEANKGRSTDEQWLTVVFGLTQGDITKYQHVMSLPHILVFNWVALGESLKPHLPKKTG